MLNHILDKLFGKMTHEQMKASCPWIFGWEILLAIALVLGCNSGCADKGDDPPNCSSTTSCTDVDGGSDVDADDDDATPDANTPDGNTAGSCADYEWLNGTVWNCGSQIYDNMTATYHADLQACIIRLEGVFSDYAENVVISADHQHLTDPTLGPSIDCWQNNL